jgi:hypothetical protein
MYSLRNGRLWRELADGEKTVETVA